VVLSLRRQQRRNFLATLLLSEGVPLLLAGDEHGRTQHGNNNAYCQDDETSWVDWSLVDGPDDLTELVASLCRLRRSSPALQRSRFFGENEIVWLRPDGEPMTGSDWSEPFARAVAATAPVGELMLLVNAWWDPLTFRLPARLRADRVSVLVDTSREDNGRQELGAVADVVVAGRSLMLLDASATATLSGVGAQSSPRENRRSKGRGRRQRAG
jgi:glycogen operon protein